MYTKHIKQKGVKQLSSTPLFYFFAKFLTRATPGSP